MRKVQPKVKKIINKSIEEARLYNQGEITIEHITIAMINDYENDAIKYLVELGVDVVERKPLQTDSNPHNVQYLSTKAGKLGHLFGDQIE